MINKKKTSGTLSKLLGNIDNVEFKKTRNRMMIAAKIAAALKREGLSQKEFAAKMKKTESEISDWLSGNRNFTIDTLTEISISLDISLLNTHSASCYTVSMDYSICNVNKNNVGVAESKKWNLSMGNIVSDKKHQLVV